MLLQHPGTPGKSAEEVRKEAHDKVRGCEPQWELQKAYPAAASMSRSSVFAALDLR